MNDHPATAEELAKHEEAQVRHGKVQAEISKLIAEISKLIAETAKINSENHYYPMIITATATLAIVAVV